MVLFFTNSKFDIIRINIDQNLAVKITNGVFSFRDESNYDVMLDTVSS